MSIVNEEALESLLRKVVRQELESVSMSDPLMTAEQVAEYLGYSAHKVYTLKRENKLRGFYLGENSLRFRRSEVERFIQERAA